VICETQSYIVYAASGQIGIGRREWQSLCARGGPRARRPWAPARAPPVEGHMHVQAQLKWAK